MDVLSRDRIRVGLASVDRDTAIRAAGRALFEAGLVEEAYIEAMVNRESTISTFMGNGCALPHGTFEAKSAILGTGIVVMQYPDGIDWDGPEAKLVIGLAAVGDDHVAVLGQLAEVLMDEELSEALAVTTDAEFVFETLSPE